MSLVFLRRLEYYKGILFLTTNRLSTFDPAFQSRIHLTIHYPDLDTAARKAIWSNFLNISSATAAFTETEVSELANENLNGRQIKNALKTAELLANLEEKALGMDSVRIVLRILKENAEAAARTFATQ